MKKGITEGIIKTAKSVLVYMGVFFKWLIIAAVTGGLGGLVGALFHLSIEYATDFRADFPQVTLLLPAGGVLIAFLYKITGMAENGGTNNVINSVKERENVPARLAPLIFISTAVTHLLGGSAGREGAALQLGGSIGAQTARLFRQKKREKNLVIMCGMSSVFSALFGTPITAAVFAMEVISVGIMHYSGLIPCVTASMAAYGVSRLFGISPERFIISEVPALSAGSVFQTAILAAMCAVVSIVFCISMKVTARGARRIFKNDYLRAAALGAVIVALSLIFGGGRYNGAGMNIVGEAVSGHAYWYDFLLKIIFTAITLAAGFRGGEIVPTFFVGACFGCVFGGMIGLDGGFAASVGLVALFCGVVNCPLAAVMLSIELFGAEGLVYYAVASAVSYMLSGYYGLYSGQRIVYSKLRAEYIDRAAK